MKITVDISDDDAALIKRLIEAVNSSSNDANSHGELSFEVLARMLMQDVALAVRRPGSWEGTNMSHVLSSHGYEW